MNPIAGSAAPVVSNMSANRGDVREHSVRARSARPYHGLVAFDRISIDHRVMGGVPCIAGTRIPVTTVVGMVAEGMTIDEILVEFPQLAVDDIRDALRFAAAAVDERELPLRPVG